MLLMAEKGIRGGICVTLFINIQKLITNTWKIMIKIKNRHIFAIFGWAMSQKLSLNHFE